MPYRLTDRQLKAQGSLSASNLQRVFESAVGEIHQADVAAKKRLYYGRPIVPRAKVLGLSQAGAQKLALSNAARALAQLWRV